MLHLCIGDTWNCITNVERRLGVSAVGCFAVWGSVFRAVKAFGASAAPKAAYVLAPSLAWISVACVLTASIWNLNGRPPVYPAEGDGDSADLRPKRTVPDGGDVHAWREMRSQGRNPPITTRDAPRFDPSVIRRGAGRATSVMKTLATHQPASHSRVAHPVVYNMASLLVQPPASFIDGGPHSILSASAGALHAFSLRTANALDDAREPF